MAADCATPSSQQHICDSALASQAETKVSLTAVNKPSKFSFNPIDSAT